MKHPNLPPLPQHEALIIGSQGETVAWLGEAVGDSAMSAAYLDNLRSLIEYAGKEKQRDLEHDAMILAGVVGRTSESRLEQTAKSNGGSLEPEIEGIIPMHTVSETDIRSSAAQFDPTQPEYKGYHDSIDIINIHATIMDVVRHELGEQPNPQ